MGAPQYFGEPEVHTFKRSNTFPIVAAEVTGTREGVGIADLTAFAKFEVTGADAATLLDRVSANKIPAADGGMRLVHMLTELGGIECEMTITRLGKDRYYLNSAIMATTHDEDWLNHHILDGEDVTVTNVTDQRGIVASPAPAAVTCSRRSPTRSPRPGVPLADGPRDHRRRCRSHGAARLLRRRARLGAPHGHRGHARRLRALVAAGEPHGLVHFGSYAMNVMRIEKGYKGWGSSYDRTHPDRGAPRALCRFRG